MSPQAKLSAYLTLTSLQLNPKAGSPTRSSPQPPKPETPEWYVRNRSVWPTPQDFRKCMIAWSAPPELAQLKSLSPPSIRNPLDRLLQDLQRDIGSVAHLFAGQSSGGGKAPTPASPGQVQDEAWYEEFVYHWMLVNTRSFHWKPHGVGEGNMVMCPFLDYMNHCPNGTGVSDETVLGGATFSVVYIGKTSADGSG